MVIAFQVVKNGIKKLSFHYFENNSMARKRMSGLVETTYLCGHFGQDEIPCEEKRGYLQRHMILEAQKISDDFALSTSKGHIGSFSILKS